MDKKERDRERARQYRKDHPGANAEYKRRRRLEHPELVAKENREYRRRNPEKVRNWPSYAKVPPEKLRARNIVNQALARGELVKTPCIECGEENLAIIEGHHEDHSKPLEVEWLCIKCHAKRGKK